MNQLTELKRLRDYYKNAQSWAAVEKMTGRRAFELVADHLDMVVKEAESER